MNSHGSQSKKLLIYEPQTEGHHLSYLQYVIEDLLEAEFQLTVALDQRPEAKALIQQQLGGLLDRVTVIAARDQSGWLQGRGTTDTVAACQKKAGVEDVFLCCFDEIASHCLRRAAFGMMPPASLRGVMGGIYVRPRFLSHRRFSFSLNQWMKRKGFARLVREGWFRRILFLDEYLHASLSRKGNASPFYFLPDPAPDFHEIAKTQARERLGLPQRPRMFLFYGGPYKRKGLDLAVTAMLGLQPYSRAYLLCAGQQPSDPIVAKGLARLVQIHRAHSINRYISNEEEELCFAACDAVLLPYRQHFGSSGVLARAAAAGKLVIASDEQLIGRRVREHNLGPLFPSGNAAELRRCIEQVANLPDDQLDRWSQSSRNYAPSCSRAAFKHALLQSFNIPNLRA
jgi:glycosyltransferase involved in cell wall biosynthesis